MSSAPSAPRRGPGRPSVVDADAIARSVLEVGFRELTFAGVAERLGVGQATLYRHASNRDELVRLGLDLALRREEWPDLDGAWRPLLERWAVAAWRAWERHPGAVLEAARGVVPPAVVVLSDGVAAALVARGFTARAAVLAVDLVFDLVADSRRGVETIDAPVGERRGGVRADIEQQWRTPPRAGAEPGAAEARAAEAEGAGPDLDADAGLVADPYPDAGPAPVHEEMIRAITADPFDWFRGKLRVVLAGIEHELGPDRRSGTGDPE